MGECYNSNGTERCTGIHTYRTGAQVFTLMGQVQHVFILMDQVQHVFTLMDQVQQASINLSIFSSQQNNSRQKDQGTSNNFYFSGSN